ncbi:MAG TPA: hypothetical protein VFR94_25985 [Nitrososphaeraceae archaeon]|nr:hypothetical protein [Nitrososphaeraceae archaeon]
MEQALKSIKLALIQFISVSFLTDSIPLLLAIVCLKHFKSFTIIPHQIDLKITQLTGGQLSEVTGFIVGPEDVVQVKQGENIMVSTSPDLTTHQVTVRNIQGIPIDLVPLPSNASGTAYSPLLIWRAMRKSSNILASSRESVELST